MISLIKPPRLKKGDKVATVSLSWGGAGDSTCGGAMILARNVYKKNSIGSCGDATYIKGIGLLI